MKQTSCEPLFSDVQMQIKMYFLVTFLRPYMHHKYGGISESHACKEGVWPIILDAELYTTCLRERVLVVMTHQVQGNIPTFEALSRKKCQLLLSRKMPYSLKTTNACYFVTECSNIAVFVRLRECMSQCIRTLSGLEQFRN